MVSKFIFINKKKLLEYNEITTKTTTTTTTTTTTIAQLML
jgi:hypothetical protein